MNNKGQSSFEILLIAAVIIILSLTVVSKFFSISDSFTAMAILKEASLEKLSSSDVKEFHAIQKIGYSIPNPGQIDLTVYFTPSFNPFSESELTEIKTKIRSPKTRFATVNIIVR